MLPKFSLFEHELRSHVPFSSSCEVCVRARGLKKARHRTEVHQNEVQLDQFWHGSLRFLILVHSKSFAIGCVSGDGPREAIVAGMSQWLMHFGLANKDCLFTCDAQGYMRTLWGTALAGLSELPRYHRAVRRRTPRTRGRAWGQGLARDCQWDFVADARQLCCP